MGGRSGSAGLLSDRISGVLSATWSISSNPECVETSALQQVERIRMRMLGMSGIPTQFPMVER